MAQQKRSPISFMEAAAQNPTVDYSKDETWRVAKPPRYVATFKPPTGKDLDSLAGMVALSQCDGIREASKRGDLDWDWRLGVSGADASHLVYGASAWTAELLALSLVLGFDPIEVKALVCCSRGGAKLTEEFARAVVRKLGHL